MNNYNTYTYFTHIYGEQHMSDTLIPKGKYIILNDKEYRIYPMLLKDYSRVERLLSKMNTEYLYLNLPTPVLDKDGKEVLDNNGKVKYDYSAFNAMCELFELALRIPRKEVVNAVDLDNGVELIDEYLGVSGLKKKMMTLMTENHQEGWTQSLQA